MRVTGVTLRRFRRSACVALTVVAAIVIGQLVGLFSNATTAGAQGVPLGTASATAQSYKVNPQTASLSLGIAFGVSLTNYQNKVAIAEARGIDLGIIGTLLAAEGCDGGDPTLPAEQQPQPVHVEARNENRDVSASNSDQGVFHKSVRATDQPMAESFVTTAPLGAPGVFEIGPGRSESYSRFLSDGTREAVAISDIAYVTFGPAAAPVAKLTSLHWEVRRLTGAKDATVQTFSIGSLVIGGTGVPVQDPKAALVALNGALNNIGIEVVPPEARSGAGFFYVDPLKIGIVPNAQRDQIAGTILGAIQEPIRQPLVDFLVAQDCGNKTYITVADVVLGSVTGAGALELELGGVNATSGEFSQFAFPGLPGLPNLGDVPPLPVTPDIGVPPAPSVGGLTTNRPVTRRARPIVPATQVGDGERGGALLIAALIGLGLIAITVELDRRKMRHAQLASELGD